MSAPQSSTKETETSATTPSHEEPWIVAVDMGYGHLRAAAAIAAAAGTVVRRGDRKPLAGWVERCSWRSVRGLYNILMRCASATPARWPFRRLLMALTEIPPVGSDPPADAIRSSHLLRRLIGAGICGGVLRAHPVDAPLISTFYAHAVAAAESGRRDVWCVVTDSDIHRVWVPVEPRRHRVRYCVPAEGTGRRLQSYGVPEEDIVVTGFPLPPERVGGRDLPVLRRELWARLLRLDRNGHFLKIHGAEVQSALGPRPENHTAAPLVAFCVGGSGAQIGAVRRVLPAAAEAVRAGRLRLLLVAGARPAVARRFRRWLRSDGLREGEGIEIVEAPEFDAYVTSFHGRLGEVDAIWTKPSEMTFMAGLGIPLLLAPALGAHEERNRELALAAGAALDTPRAAEIPDRVLAAVEDGSLAAAAWAGFKGFPADGAWRILDAVRR
jgi:hypothetical protein